MKTRGEKLVSKLIDATYMMSANSEFRERKQAVIDAIDESRYDEGYEDGWVAAHQELVGADNPPERTCKPILNPAKYDYWHVCGACHAGLRAIDNYCPNCGCRIESEQS